MKKIDDCEGSLLLVSGADSVGPLRTRGGEVEFPLLVSEKIRATAEATGFVHGDGYDIKVRGGEEIRVEVNPFSEPELVESELLEAVKAKTGKKKVVVVVS